MDDIELNSERMSILIGFVLDAVILSTGAYLSYAVVYYCLCIFSFLSDIT